MVALHEPLAGGPLALIVDDDRVARTVLASTLGSSGFTPLEAEDGVGALDVLEHQAVAVVVVDQAMPGMTGLELTRRIRSMPGQQLLPILFLSALDDPLAKVEALDAGASDFIIKPARYDEVAARVKAQVRMSSQWKSTVDDLQRRAATVAGIARLPREPSIESSCRFVCETLSIAHSGSGVAVLAWNGRRMDLVAEHNLHLGAMDRAEVSANLGSRHSVWRQTPSDTAATRGLVCAPLRYHGAAVGVLVVEDRSGDAQLPAAVLDYSTSASIHIGGALHESADEEVRRAEVGRAISTESFETLFQPIVDLRNGRTVGWEALTRMTHERSIVEFLALATETGMQSAFEMALALGAIDSADGLADEGWISINLSPSVLLANVELLASRIDECIHPYLVVELTENEPIDDYDAVRRALRRLGPRVRLAVDDAGAGYASLRHVVDLRPDFLKLDRSWVAALEGDETRQALVAGVVAFCRRSGIELIAEGVERQAERDVLVELGVPFAQGFLIGRPAPASQWGARLN